MWTDAARASSMQVRGDTGGGRSLSDAAVSAIQAANVTGGGGKGHKGKGGKGGRAGGKTSGFTVTTINGGGAAHQLAVGQSVGNVNQVVQAAPTPVMTPTPTVRPNY